MSTRALPRGRRRWLTAGALGTLLLVTASGCYGTWGTRESFRGYVNQPFAHGGITTEAGATWLDGDGLAEGPFQWTVASAELDPVTETGFIQFSGGVRMYAHPVGADYAMDMSFWNPRLELDGDEGTLVVDLNYRPYEGMAPGELPDLEAAIDIDFAEVDLSGFDWTLSSNGTYTITDAPMTGIDTTMALIGWDDFYGPSPVLDPISTSFNEALFAPALNELPRITVSRTTDLHVGDTIIVSGSGFAPTSGNGTRPPLSGQPGGSYVTFGRFADVWQPSAGSTAAPSSSRHVISQRWALPEPSFTFASTNFPNPAYTPIDEYGSFAVAVEITGLGTAATGNYGIYSYPGSGAVNADYELSVPLTVSA